MSDVVLGLDLGPTSIGWALLDVDGALVGSGVRVFPEGVDRDQKGGELSKNETRRVARGMRRQITRRARRKWRLRHELVAAGLLPSEALLPREDKRRDRWESEQFHRADPYALRERALRERLELHDFGRVLLHLGQRRGFLSNRRADRARKKENSVMLQEISQLAERMGDKTVGQHMAGQKQLDPLARVRGQHTRREMYEREFEAVWKAQAPHHPRVLTDDLRKKLEQTLFFQRKMYWPASVIGHCELEPRLPRCPRADRRAQRFRLLNEVNNLRVLDRSNAPMRTLTAEERQKLIAYLAAGKERTFDQIRKHLFEEHDGIRFNLETPGRDKLLGIPTDATLSAKSVLGKAWRDVDEEMKDRVVTAVIDADESRVRWLATQLAWDEEVVQKLLELDLGDGYSSYSLFAIKKLLPHLEAGLPLSSRDGAACALAAAEYIRPWERVPNQQPLLPPPPALTNPIVRAALHEVRKVVNAVLRDLVTRAGHKLVDIHVELAREARGTAEQRRRYALDTHKREKQRDMAADRIRADVPGVRLSRAAINSYLLWREQDEFCVYCGREISVVQLFGGDVDVDHILPYPRSLDDSMNNKVVCHRGCNADKSDRTPHEWLADKDATRYELVLQLADKMPVGKANRFRQPTVSLDDFFERQFVDTSYITTQVRQYLRCLGIEPLCTKGTHTAELRHHWGLDDVLRHDGKPLKNREDHRHHAVDAIVIALTNRSRLQKLAQLRKAGGTRTTGEVLSEPWDTFRSDVQKVIDAIYVSHRSRRKVCGALHEETIYGPTETPGEFVYRKPVESLTVDMLDAIRDRTIQQIVKARVDAFKDRITGNKIPTEVWKEPLCMPSGVPIRKVRVTRKDLTIQPIRGGRAFVKTGALHHACIFEWDERGKRKRDAVYVSMLEAAARLRRKEPIIRRSHPDHRDARFVMSVTTGDQLLMNDDGGERLVVVSTLVSTQKRIHVVDARDARMSSDKKDQGKTPNSLVAKKVVVDPIGRLRWARD